MFNLDFPKAIEIDYLTKFSGWYIPENNRNIKLSLFLNGKPYASLLHGGYRPDVATAFPEKKYASHSGFWGELLLPETIKPETDIKIQIFADGAEKTLLFQNNFKVVGNIPNPPQRQRNFHLEKLLICPECGKKNSPCNAENCPVWMRGNTPHILQPGDLPFIKLTETETTHPYSEGILKVLNKINKIGENGIVLDFGAGNTQKEYLRPNICYLDVQQYQYTDIVCSTLKLPFPDNCFDGIISHAVFEHLPNPFITAKELYRILKPGGLIFIDTAFLQPLHADPSHYFNMTVHGLRQILSDFEEVNSGIFPHHYPSYSMMMLIQTIWPHIQQKEWQKRLEDWHAFLVQEGDNLDMALGEKGREILAAGVFFEGKKTPVKPMSWRLNYEIKKPDFLIIGGQKCGTNSLYNYLVQHPLIAPSLQHEIHYFDLNFDKELDWYKSQFPELEPGMITGESSPYYLFHPLVAQRVFDIYPQIKLIVLLRNPVERAISHYYHEVKLGYEKLSLSEAIASETTRLEGEIEKIIKTGTYYSFNHQHYTYLSRGIYIEQLQNWMSIFPKEQFLILKSEDLFSHPLETMNKVFQFLELPPHYSDKYLKYNSGDYSPPRDKIYQQLVEYFQSDNQKLAKYLGIDLNW